MFKKEWQSWLSTSSQREEKLDRNYDNDEFVMFHRLQYDTSFSPSKMKTPRESTVHSSDWWVNLSSIGL